MALRGIDVEHVNVLVNYDLPINVGTEDVDKQTYLHRITITGRFGREGIAINFVDSHKTMAFIEELETHFGRKISKLDANDIDQIEKINPQ